MKRFALAGLLALTTSGTAWAAACFTNTDGCSGSWRVENTTGARVCYTIFWGGGNSTKNFCLEPGESATEQVRTGDAFCVANGSTPSPNTCVRQPMLAQ